MYLPEYYHFSTVRVKDGAIHQGFFVCKHYAQLSHSNNFQKMENFITIRINRIMDELVLFKNIKRAETGTNIAIQSSLNGNYTFITSFIPRPALR